MKYFFLLLLLSYSIAALIGNIKRYYDLRKRKALLSLHWYKYDEAQLICDEAIYPGLISLISEEAVIWISMFMWPYAKDAETISGMFDIELARYLALKNVSGRVFVDSINLDYKVTPKRIKNNAVMKAAGDKISWHVNSQPYALPNNLFMWFIHMPWLQTILYNSKMVLLQQVYSVFKLSSNHQKVVVIDNGSIASIGSRNFNRINWNNKDNMLVFNGDFASMIYHEAASTIIDLNPGIKSKVALNDISALSTYSIDLLANTSMYKLARILKNAEIKSSILYLINNSTCIEAAVSILTDADILDAFNQFILRGGKLRLILDPNNYMFSYKFPNMPNIIPILKLSPDAKVGIYNTSYQMHNKTALFNLANGNSVILGGSANWTAGALSHFAFNDIGFLVLNDEQLNKSFQVMMDVLWQSCTRREEVKIKFKFLKFWASKLMLFTGINPW